MTVTDDASRFVDDPVASVSGRFPLGAPAGASASVDVTSPIGLRAWGLRDLTPARRGTLNAPVFQYDPIQQLSIGPDGMPAVSSLAGGPPTADTTSTVDGEDPPSSEDWNNDFHEDGPFQV